MHVTVAHVAVAWLLALGVLGFVYWGIREYRPPVRLQRRIFVLATCILCTPAMVPELSTAVPWPLGAVMILTFLDDPNWILGQGWLLFAVFLAVALGGSTALSRVLFREPPTPTMR